MEENQKHPTSKKALHIFFLSTSIWMRFLLERDCGDHVPFCFITTRTVCSSGTFFFWSLSPLHNRTGILRKTTKATIKKHKAWKLTWFLRFNMKNQDLISYTKRIYWNLQKRGTVQHRKFGLMTKTMWFYLVNSNILKYPCLSCRL